MTLSSTEMKVLEAQSASFGNEHKSCLAQAIDAVRGSGDPRKAIQLLTALSSTARAKQKTALIDVRRWIEGRLRTEPGVSAQRMLLELGWLRRMSIARGAGLMESVTRRQGLDRDQRRRRSK